MKKMKAALLCGMLGCLCYGAGDWLMIYGDPAHEGALSWLVPVSEAVMLPVFLYWFYLQISGNTVFPKWMAFTSVLVFYALLRGLTMAMPAGAFRLAFENGLMSESMLLWFGCMLLREAGRTSARGGNRR